MQNYMQEVQINCLVKLAKDKVWFGELTVSDMTIAVDWDVKPQTKQKTNTEKVNFEKQTTTKACEINASKELIIILRKFIHQFLR